jgi:hypothetical protein
MRSKTLFQIFESGLTKTSPCFSNNGQLLLTKHKLPKASFPTLPSHHSPVPEEQPLNISSENSFEESLPEVRSRSPRAQLDSENDFSYIKTDYTHVCMLQNDELFGLDWNLGEMEECASIVFGDETDFKDLFFNLENF